MDLIDASSGEILRSPRVRTRFNYDMGAVSLATALVCPEETRTQQNFKEECDINTIVRRFGLTGQLPDQGVRMPQYVDYEGVFDFHSAMNSVLEAEKAFMQLSADVRRRFDNDPQKLLAFCEDAGNLDEARSLGLAPPVPAPVPAPAAPPEAAPAAS